MSRVLLDIRIERKGKIHNSSLRIAKTDLYPVDGRAQVQANAGKSYWVFFFIEGNAGASAELTVTDPAGKSLLTIAHAQMTIPPGLGRNGGSFEFKVA